MIGQAVGKVIASADGLLKALFDRAGIRLQAFWVKKDAAKKANLERLEREALKTHLDMRCEPKKGGPKCD
jgi:hypothetical protein